MFLHGFRGATPRQPRGSEPSPAAASADLESRDNYARLTGTRLTVALLHDVCAEEVGPKCIFVIAKQRKEVVALVAQLRNELEEVQDALKLNPPAGQPVVRAAGGSDAHHDLCERCAWANGRSIGLADAVSYLEAHERFSAKRGGAGSSPSEYADIIAEIDSLQRLANDCTEELHGPPPAHSFLASFFSGVICCGARQESQSEQYSSKVSHLLVAMEKAARTPDIVAQCTPRRQTASSESCYSPRDGLQHSSLGNSCGAQGVAGSILEQARLGAAEIREEPLPSPRSRIVAKVPVIPKLRFLKQGDGGEQSGSNAKSSRREACVTPRVTPRQNASPSSTLLEQTNGTLSNSPVSRISAAFGTPVSAPILSTTPLDRNARPAGRTRPEPAGGIEPAMVTATPPILSTLNLDGSSQSDNKTASPPTSARRLTGLGDGPSAIRGSLQEMLAARRSVVSTDGCHFENEPALASFGPPSKSNDIRSSTAAKPENGLCLDGPTSGFTGETTQAEEISNMLGSVKPEGNALLCDEIFSATTVTPSLPSRALIDCLGAKNDVCEDESRHLCLSARYDPAHSLDAAISALPETPIGTPRMSPRGSLSETLAARRSVVDAEGIHFESDQVGAKRELEPAESAALIFPDQDVQRLGMLGKVQDIPAVSSMLQRAQEILGYDLRQLCTDGPQEDLMETRNSQVAVFVSSLAAVEVLRGRSPETVARPSAVCGLGVGEYAALVVARVLDFENALRLVRLRAEAMHDASARGAPQMQLLVIGLSLEEANALCEEALSCSPRLSPRSPDSASSGTSDDVCQVSQVLAADCCFISGTLKPVTFARELVRKRASESQSGSKCKANFFDNRQAAGIGAFQTSCMMAAQRRLRAELDKVLPSMRSPCCDVYFNATGKSLVAGSSPRDVCNFLAVQLTTTALWEPTLRGLAERRLEKYFDMGSGGKMKDLLRKVSKDAWRRTDNITTWPSDAGGLTPRSSTATISGRWLPRDQS